MHNDVVLCCSPSRLCNKFFMHNSVCNDIIKFVRIILQKAVETVVVNLA